MEKPDERNAKLDSAYLGGWDNSVPSSTVVISLMFSGEHWGQGSGHFGGEIERFIVMTLKTLEVSNWNKLPGTFCRIRRDRGRIVAVGHIIKDQWFTFQNPYSAKEKPHDTQDERVAYFRGRLEYV